MVGGWLRYFKTPAIGNEIKTSVSARLGKACGAVQTFCHHCLTVIPWEASVYAQCSRDVPPPVVKPCKQCEADVLEGMEKWSVCRAAAPWL